MTNIQPTNTTAFYAQAAISFAVSFSAVLVGVAYLPGDGWMRAFLALSVLYVVTSTFTLAKCVRDQQEQGRVVQRVDEVRLERLLAEHDPFKTMS
ncbi:MAG TPA: YiaA/YiaB family inner membrane protein [Mycobacteriales bacterium]|nr:YiaA/YiaB family inner membrane protein [Mycobacteriales bacterium]